MIAYIVIAAGLQFSPGTVVSSTNKWQPWYNSNIVETGTKYHTPKPNPILLYWLLWMEASFNENKIHKERWLFVLLNCWPF